MSSRLAERVDRSATALGDRTSRRGFLTKTAVVGTALVADPFRFIFRPGSAYAATCGCGGQSCNCASMCCDGYTEFCCTITGENSCPDGTVLGGWWKADGSGYCGGPRYYMDCNVVPGQSPCSCGCAKGNCANRKSCCTHFRYGQCHQEYPTLGAIMCRVVTCTPPWEFDATCTKTSATDNNTRFHDAPCLNGVPEVKDDVPAPAICFDSEGRRWVFVRGVDGALWSKTNNANWVKVGGVLTSGPSATAGADGRIDVVVRGGDNGAWTNSYVEGAWTGWVALGGRS